MDVKRITLTLAALMLSACAITPSPQALELQAYTTKNRALAEAGQLPWSEYYEGAYSRAVSANLPAAQLTRLIEMIRTAQQYEQGSITKDDFMRARRLAQATTMGESQAAAERDRQQRVMAATAFSGAMSAASAASVQYQPVQVQPFQPQSYSLPTYTATATWTGRQNQVRTVTYQHGWNCEYMYAGQKFWRVFLSSCPGAVPVQ